MTQIQQIKWGIRRDPRRLRTPLAISPRLSRLVGCTFVHTAAFGNLDHPIQRLSAFYGATTAKVEYVRQPYPAMATRLLIINLS